MKQATALISAAIAVSLLSVCSMASGNISYKTDSDYFTVNDEDVTITITDTGEKASPETFPLPPLQRSGDKTPIVAAAIINGGMQAWAVCRGSRP